MKLALGTAQFGLDYGISNKQGQVDKNQIAEILTLATCLGIDTLDCAGAYGNSEKVLGEIFAQSPQKKHFTLVGKIPALSAEQKQINHFFDSSLQHLQRDKIETLLFHHADNLLNHPKKEQLFQQLQSIKMQGKVNRIGVSVYSPEQLKAIIQHYPIDIAQVPLNIFDQRFISAEILTLCQQSNLKLHVRSLFLQGLLLIEQDKLPTYFAPYQAKLLAFETQAKRLNCSRLCLALAVVTQDIPFFDAKSHDDEHQPDITVKQNDFIEKVIVGVCSSTQLAEVVKAYQQAQELPVSRQELLTLADERLGFINPSLWPTETR
jgi:aryl-alcohol dehydrogenase-like predicted oxidoreductase